MTRERYFLNRHTGKVYVDRHFPARFTREPDRYRELSATEYAALTAIRAQFLNGLRPYSQRHAGQTAHLFGNGPSLLEFAARQDWTGRLTIGVNAAGLHIRPLSYWLSVDNLTAAGQRDLYDWIEGWLPAVRGRTVTLARFGSPLCLRGFVTELKQDQLAAGAPGALARGQKGAPAGEGARRSPGDALAGWLPDAMFAQAGEPAERPDEALYWTASSVQAALDLARLMGCRRAVLWGVDYHDRGHAYTGSREIPGDLQDQPGRPWEHWDRIVHGFTVLRDACAARGLEVFNANPRSRLTVFPFLAPEAAFGADAGAPCKSSDLEAATPSPAQHTRLFTFYTPGTPYEVLAQDGVAAFSRFGLTVEAVPYPDTGDWMRNALARAPRLAALANQYPRRAVGMLDADVRPLDRPERLFNFEGDCAVEDRGPHRPRHDRYSAGVLLFGPTPLGRRLLAHWAGRCQADAEPARVLREQKYLHDAIEELRREGLRVTNLGNAYNRLPEQRREGDGTVLLHAPASRFARAQIGGKR